jgi:DNA adenine methylase
LETLKEFASDAAPFVKWAGGKGQLLHTFEAFFPRDFGTYLEPFLGGGAVFFYLFKRGRIGQARISDANKDLINCYVTIRDNLDQLLVQAKRLQKHATDKKYYYEVARKRFNEIRLETGQEGNVEKAALLLYLNRTCFNGLYRVNSNGAFNVPWGDYTNPRILNERNLGDVSWVLNQSSVKILRRDYTVVLDEAKAKDFVYFDPPYLPISQTASFTSYTPDSFTLDDQKKLADLYNELAAKGCRLMLSNSPKVRDLYEGHGYEIVTVKAARAISSVGLKRGPIEELVVMNY